MDAGAPAQIRSASRDMEAMPSSPEDGSRMAPLNLSRKSETKPAAACGPVYRDFAELQDAPLNLSVRDPCNALTPRPAFHHPPGEVEHPAAAAQKAEPEGSGDGSAHTDTKQNSPGSDEAPVTTPTRKAQDIRATDSGDEQKQTAAVALCQLAAYSPGAARVGDGEPSAQEPTCQNTAAPGATESQEAQSDLRPKGQKRTSPREAGKSQQGAKKSKPSDTARVFTLRKRTRVS